MLFRGVKRILAQEFAQRLQKADYLIFMIFWIRAFVQFIRWPTLAVYHNNLLPAEYGIKLLITPAEQPMSEFFYTWSSSTHNI